MTGKRKDDGHGVYVRRVREHTHKYIQEILAENARLAHLVASLENEKVLLDEDKARLKQEVQRLQRRLRQHQQKAARLQKEISEVEVQRRRFAEKFMEVEGRNNDLAHLYVACYQIHGTVDRASVLTAIHEILINLVGSEQFAIFELSQDRKALCLISSFGVNEKRYRSLPVGGGLLGNVARNGKIFLAGERGEGVRLPEEEGLTAGIPLKIDGRVTGLIALFQLLPQKGGRLGALDLELLDLLANQAAAALYLTTLHSRLAAGPEVPA